MAIRSLRVKDAMVYRDHVQAIKSGLVSNLVSYNSMLSAYVGSGGYEPEALDLFTRMQSAHETIGID
ncbi:hypothetical protein JHK84_033149 [Glycine max]|nr:hypothetical protein JHK84_033149 [Glycine max]